MATDNRFAPNSRYTTTETAEWVQADGRRVAYLRRRFVPDPARFVTLQEYLVVEGDHIDRAKAAVRAAAAAISERYGSPKEAAAQQDS